MRVIAAPQGDTNLAQARALAGPAIPTLIGENPSAASLRTGSLFEKPFRRRRVDSDRYFSVLIAYIHHNLQKHGFVDDFRDWPYSSYHAFLSNETTRLQRAAVLGWFDGTAGFKEAHVRLVDEASIKPLILEDWL